MTQLAISDELAATIANTASKRGCTPQQLLEAMFSETETDDAYVDRLLTPEIQARMIEGANRAKQGEFVTSKEVDQKFAAFFQELRSR